MNARTLTTGFALSASLLFATSAMAVNASPDSGLEGHGAPYTIAHPDSSVGGRGERITAQPDASVGGAGRIIDDADRGDDLASERSGSLVRFLAIFAGGSGSWAYRLFAY